jgi:hypothetical protein
MSVEMYRRQVAQIRSGIAKLMEQKAKDVQKAADAGKKSLAAQSSASRATSSLQHSNPSYVKQDAMRTSRSGMSGRSQS